MSDELPKKLIRNAVQCVGCMEIIESKHRHDFVGCSCGATFVDGGLAYNRVGWKEDPGPPIDLCEYEES